MLTIGQKQWLNTEIMDTLGVDESELTNDATFAELGADSLDEIEIVMAVEREYDVQIEDEMLSDVKNLGDFYDLVDKVINK